MFAVIQTDNNGTVDDWISAVDGDGSESAINPTRSDPAELVSLGDSGYAKIRWRGNEYEVQSIDLDYLEKVICSECERPAPDGVCYSCSGADYLHE